MHHHPIPFLDAAGLLREDEDFTTSLREACVAKGVFHLLNSDCLFGAHRPPPIDDAIDATKAFFALPTSEKRRFERSKDRAAGFSDCELTKQILDIKEVLDIAWVPRPELPLDHELNVGIDGYNVFPDGNYQAKLLTYYHSAVKNVCNRLMRAFCVAFDMDYEAVRAALLDETRSIGFMRLNYYARAGETMNIHEHTDAGLFTVLWANDVRGLEYEDPSTGEFIRLDQLPEDSLTLTINVGDMFQVLTNGRVRAPKHRVICDPDLYTGFEFPRYSIALFLNPSEHAVVSPALNTDERGTELPPLYRDVPWTEFRRRRFAGDLADEGRDEVQIKDYQLSP